MGVGGFLGVCFTRDLLQAGYPLKLYFEIPCAFPAWRQIFPVPIYIICEYYIHRTDLAASGNKEIRIFFVATIAISFTF